MHYFILVFNYLFIIDKSDQKENFIIRSTIEFCRFFKRQCFYWATLCSFVVYASLQNEIADSCNSIRKFMGFLMSIHILHRFQ